MSKRLAQEEAEQKVEKICKEKNYELVEQFIYVNWKTLLHLKCKNDGHIWKISYNNLLNNKGCPKCANVISPSQAEAEQKVRKICEEKNYELTKSFVYKNALKTILHLKCENNHTWISTYNNFVNGKYGCLKCSFIKIRKLNEQNNIWTKEELIPKFRKYKIKVHCLTRRNKKLLLQNWNGLDFYDSEYIKNNFNLNPNDSKYPTIDHKISIFEGYKNEIQPEEISKINNLVITKRYLNRSKSIKNLKVFLKQLNKN